MFHGGLVPCPSRNVFHSVDGRGPRLVSGWSGTPLLVKRIPQCEWAWSQTSLSENRNCTLILYTICVQS